MCRKPIGHGLFLRCLRGNAGGDVCVGIGLDFLLRMTGFVVPDGMQWSVGIFPLFSQCDPAGRRPAMCGRKRMIIIAHSAQLSPHCTGGGIRSDGGSSARSGRAKRRAAGECRGRLRTLPSRYSRSGAIFCAATVQSFVPAQGEPPSDPDEVPCGHFWRHLLVTKGGKSAPRRKHPIRGTELSQRKRESISLFFCAFGLIQKHQKIKHGEK